MGDSETEPFSARAKRLAEARGWSAERLAYEAWSPDIRGTSAAMLKKVITGKRNLKPHMVTAVADALGVPADEFPEHRLAKARRLFDEEQVGLDEALRNLSLLDAALEAAADVAEAPLPQPASDRSPRRKRAPGASPPKSRGD